MKARLKLMRVIPLLIVVALVAAGCGATAAPGEPTPGDPTPTQEPAGPTPATGQIGGSNPAGARDVALAYLAQTYGEQAPPAGLDWTEKDVTGQGLLGASTFEYTSGDWTITISYPIVAPQATIYRITLDNPATGFSWAGRVDAWGAVSEGPEAVLNARDVALASIARQYGVQAPPAELSWSGGRKTPEGVVGSETYEYTAGDWKVKITYPVTAPEQVVYSIEVTNETQSFQWQGEMDAQGNLTVK
jgi:hypothetical protein